jgi:hypothetical protein
MRSTWLKISLLTVATCWGQTMVEHAVITGAGASAAGGMSKAGQGIAGVLDKAVKTLNSADSSNSAPASKMKAGVTAKAPVSRTAVSEPIPPQDLHSPVNPAEIVRGMTASDLLAKAGTPALSITENSSTERLSFNLKSGGAIEVTLRDGVVTGVKRVE